jgi:hypothetical protein
MANELKEGLTAKGLFWDQCDRLSHWLPMLVRGRQHPLTGCVQQAGHKKGDPSVAWIQF